MLSLISKKHIHEQYTQVLNDLYTVVSISKWSIQPQGWLLTKAKTKYGMADINGYVHINHLFLNTPYWTLLDKVIRHELAHLCVGLGQGHNAEFHRVEGLFDGVFNQTCLHQARRFNELVTYKYKLLAVFPNGEEVMLKHVHRKYAKYTQYTKQRRTQYYIDGRLIRCFKYKPI